VAEVFIQFNEWCRTIDCDERFTKKYQQQYLTSPNEALLAKVVQLIAAGHFASFLTPDMASRSYHA